MLMNDFYTLSDIAREGNKWNGRIRFNAAHAIFTGHFPGQPVVPGVCMMQIVKEVMELILNKKMQIQQAGQVKFLQLITPEITPFVHIEWETTEDDFVVSASFKAEKDLFKMNARMVAQKKI